MEWVRLRDFKSVLLKKDIHHKAVRVQGDDGEYHDLHTPERYKGKLMKRHSLQPRFGPRLTFIRQQITLEGPDAWPADLLDGIASLCREVALPAPLSQQIQIDAFSIASVLGALHADRELEVKLEVCGEDRCIRWHQDCFVSRAIVSYTGVEGTKYTSDSNVNFWELDNCGNADHLIYDKKEIKSIDVGDILFIKGKKYGH